MIAVLSYIVFCLVLAYINYRRIAYDKRILHGVNALFHFAFWVLVYFLSKSPWLTLSLPFLGRLFFDTSLSLFRGLPLDYVAKYPKSIIDKVEKRVFGNNGIIPKIIYLAIAITLIIISHGQYIS